MVLKSLTREYLACKGSEKMAVTVNHLYKNATKLYKMKLIAGINGLNHLVQWVHIIEDEDVSKFLHGQEIVFTTGMLSRKSGQLLEFAKKIYQSDASAFLINLGPYIEKVPKEVIEYCNKVEMPLFVMPWETPMVDVTRDFCRRIMEKDTVENSLSSILKNIIYKIGDMETQIQQMERHGFDRDSNFTFVSIVVGQKTEKLERYGSHQKNMEKISRCAEQAGRNIRDTYLSFYHKSALVVVLVDYTKQEIERFVKELQQLAVWHLQKDNESMMIGISQNIQGISKQEDNLEKAMAAMFISGKKQKTMYYDELDIYKLLVSVKEKDVLEECYNEVVGKLKKYDIEHRTNLRGFLQIYMKNNGSQQLVAKEMFIHRNTVNNQLKKIEKITGLDPAKVEVQVKIYLGFCVENMM